MATESSYSIAKQLQELMCTFVAFGPETRQSVLDKLDSTIENLKRIRIDLAADGEDASNESDSELDSSDDAAWVEKYGITYDDYVKWNDETVPSLSVLARNRKAEKMANLTVPFESFRGPSESPQKRLATFEIKTQTRT
jgi:hypothetical protein